MMASKRLSIEEQIEKKEESIKQLQNQKRQLKKKLNEQERKARNKRLIEKGAVFESIFEESIDLTKDEFYKLIKTLNDEEITRLPKNRSPEFRKSEIKNFDYRKSRKEQIEDFYISKFYFKIGYQERLLFTVKYKRVIYRILLH